jgi:amino acid adenylation domain-containing protein
MTGTRPRTLYDLLRDGAARHPERIAVVDRSGTVTYSALAARAEGFAAALSAQGIAAGDRVGHYVEKSIAAVAAIFGILATGAAYVPLDPRAPSAHVARRAADACLHGLLTTAGRLVALRQHLRPLPHVCLLIDESGVGAAAPPRHRGTGDDLAHILYTSGSTGAPKGVMVSHRAALSFVAWATEQFRLGEGDIVASHAPFHFDLSTFDLFATIAAGATIALVPDETAMFPRSLAAWIAASGISVWYSVPTALVQLVQRGGLSSDPFPALRLVLFAGEVFPTRELAALMRLVPRAAFFNLYGPTETNVCSAHPVMSPPADDAAPIPIGTVCGHCTVRVRGDDGRVVPNGAIGELVITGESLMTGYWGKPELTAAAFVADPLEPASTRQFYRSGDCGWRDPDGVLHFAGRRDAQVKIRGHRVELGEIETVLGRHPAILEAVVLARPGDAVGPALTAFIVADADQALDRRLLANFCADRLPGYMIPRDIVFLSAMPRTPTGKLDRAALAALDQVGGDGRVRR